MRKEKERGERKRETRCGSKGRQEESKGKESKEAGK